MSRTMNRGVSKKTSASTPRYSPVVKLPPLSDEQVAALRDNIAVNGVIVPIVVDGEGRRRKIIDGNYRKKIADELGYDCPEIVQPDLDDAEKRTLARALNLSRRQLTQDQKRRLIADQLIDTPERSNRWIGKQLGVTHPTVASVRAELESTGKIFQLDETLGSDGKTRRVKCGNKWLDYTPLNDTHTPLSLCNYLHKIIRPHYHPKIILDPCAGSGNLTRPWNEADVIDFEIKEGRDFFRRKQRIRCDMVLCNPPFSDPFPFEFLKHIVKVVARRTPIVYVCPFSLLYGNYKSTPLYKWLLTDCPPISSQIILPRDTFVGATPAAMVVCFNMPKLKPSYTVPRKYLVRR